MVNYPHIQKEHVYRAIPQWMSEVLDEIVTFYRVWICCFTPTSAFLGQKHFFKTCETGLRGAHRKDGIG